MLSAKIFREHEICGIADSDLLDEDVEVLGRALASYLIRYSGRIICLGRDSRSSSTRLHAALRKGLLRSGAHVLDIDVVPAAVLFYSGFHFSADAAIMITGGDETPEHNGFRIVCGASLLFGRALEDIYKLIQIADFEVEDGNVKHADAVTPYLAELASQFQLPKTVKFAFHSGSPAVRSLLQKLLKELNASLVKKSEAAVAVTISDEHGRLEVADENGQRVAPEMLLLLFAREILTRKPGSALLYDERFPESVVRKLIELGGRPIAITASDPSIHARIKQERAELCVQASGEIVFADRYYGFEDAIYATCRLLEIMALMEDGLSGEVSRLADDLMKPAA